MTDTEKTLEPEAQKEVETVTSTEPEVQRKDIQETEVPEAAAAEKVEEEAVIPDTRKKRSVKKLAILIAASVVLIAAIVLFVMYGLPAIRYSSGVRAFDNGDYTRAVAVFSALEDYKESNAYLAQAELGVHYTNAGIKVQAGEYDEAIKEYKNAKDFQNAKALLKETYVLYGDSLLSQGKYDEAVKEYRNASESGKVAQAYDQKGEALFRNKQYVEAAEAFASSGNEDRQLDCSIALAEEQKDYVSAIAVLENHTSPETVPHWNYANGMLSMDSGDYQAAMEFFGECSGLLDADVRRKASTFLMAEKCLHEGYLNKAKALYESLPEGYVQDDVVVADRIMLLNDNSKFLNLVGNWSATDTYYKVQADSTTSSYYYYWYQDGLNLGTVTVTCPYNDDGTFTVKGTATFPSYQNFSSYASQLETDMEKFSFSTTCKGSIPYQVDSSSTTKLSFNGSQFDLQYKYVNDFSNVYWHYTFTSKVKYGTRYMLAEDR